ncbi:rubredoxin-like domain-containing protein [Desulfopila aestuarii]|uniref:Predicted membrane protein n=1 Tax=Desulfopila aestuarii DSM 18488 TaxID=1121416 RepID=A0A1M7XXB6_9BACT|nr:DUF2231 domain-containing protein [Desulfopila aestuarii]SHO43557.1 Predicted membrane protein [Desulfopila aestuarii DSM 18488]
MKKWKCTVCGYIYEGEAPPEKCPLCKAPAEMFEEVVEDQEAVVEKASVSEQPPVKEEKREGSRWKCTICGYILEGDVPPKDCPICKAAAEKFVEIDGDGNELPPVAKVETKDTSAPVQAKKPGFIVKMMMRLHLHPISVHMPNGILPIAVIFLAISIFLNIKAFEPAAFYNLVAVLITMPLVLLTGFTEWKNRYQGAKTFIFFMKIFCSAVVTISLIILVAWRFFEPGVAEADSPFRLIYFGVAAVMLGATGIAGHLGGKLVFGARDKMMKK